MSHRAFDAVAELIKVQRMRIDITAEVGYSVTAPCLLSQLAEAVAGGIEAGGRGVPGSRPTIAIDALDLWVRILHCTHTWADACGVSRRDGAPDNPTPWVGRLLRSTVATAVSRGHVEMADQMARSATDWAREIRAMLTGEFAQRGIRGAVCPECERTSMIERRHEGKHVEHYRVPVIVLITETLGDAGRLRWLSCVACGWYSPLGHGDVTVLTHISESLDTEADQVA